MRWSQAQAEAYQRRAQRYAPKAPIARNAVMAFLIGGSICLVGQVILSLLDQAGMPFSEAVVVAACLMIVLGALLTGVGVYDEIGRFGGMGAALPITGFANAIVAPAMEAKREGYVFGVGSKLFTIAGPVIIYGLLVALLSSALRYWLVGPA